MGGTTRRRQQSSPIPSGIHSTRLHVHLYGLLLVATPFLLLRRFLQDAIGRLSSSTLPVGDGSVPIVPALAGILILAVIAVFRRRMTRRVVLAGLVGLAMIALAQRMADIYFGHRFYELQQNWHYLAYGIFAYMTYRDLRPRGVSAARYLLVTLGLALACSALDEGFQLLLSNRVFDMSDIAKDAWGAFTGMTVLLLVWEPTAFGRRAWSNLRHSTIAGYFRHAPSVWILEFFTVVVFLYVSSLLTEYRYVGTIVLCVVVASAAFLALLHLSRTRWGGRVLVAAGAALVLSLGVSGVVHRHDQIGFHRYGMTIYKGIPVPFFDVMARPNGTFRPVDKKHQFNDRDRAYFFRARPDILLIGSGYREEGGKGFPLASGSQFLYNPVTGRGTQVIIVNTRDACSYFNELRRQGKNVLFILHSTC